MGVKPKIFIGCLVWLTVSIFSCKPGVKKVVHNNIQDSVHYQNLIMATVANEPNLYGIRGPESIYFLKKDIVTIRREVKDTALDVTLRLHTWGDGQGYPPIIIYVSNSKGFEYAFAFRDEGYRRLIGFYKNDDKEFARWLKSGRNFTTQLNFILYGLGFNKASEEAKAQRFITLLEDSLMGRIYVWKVREKYEQELTLKDTTFLSNALNKQLSRDDRDSSYCKPCTDSIKINTAKIITELRNNQNNRIRYFKTYEGGGAYWRFEIIIEKDSSLFVNTSFANEACYRCTFW